MKKIGIITMYHNSLNSGGNLQAYALCKFLNDNGYDAEQIAYDYSRMPHPENTSLIDRLKNKSIIEVLSKIKYKFRMHWHRRQIINLIERRKKEFENFNKNIILHSKKVYNDFNIGECNNIYDIFITGSDQVWNLANYRPAFFLDFVTNKRKLSYASSISMNELKPHEEALFAKLLCDFSRISLRESDSIPLLQKLLRVELESCLDPTFLLDVKDWNKLIDKSNYKGKHEKYIFSYFMGDNEMGRKLALSLSKKKSIKLVNIPMANGNIVAGDFVLGIDDTSSFDPILFIKYIRDAEYIFTDSYHAMVFSILFKKRFFVFNRNNKKEMNSRIMELCNLFNLESRYCDGPERESIAYVEKNYDLKYENSNYLFDKKRQESINYLLNAINSK